MVTACVRGRAASQNSQDVEYVSRASSDKRVSMRFRPTVTYRWHLLGLVFQQPAGGARTDKDDAVTGDGGPSPYGRYWRSRRHPMRRRRPFCSSLRHGVCQRAMPCAPVSRVSRPRSPDCSVRTCPHGCARYGTLLRRRVHCFCEAGWTGPRCAVFTHYGAFSPLTQRCLTLPDMPRLPPRNR